MCSAVRPSFRQAKSPDDSDHIFIRERTPDRILVLDIAAAASTYALDIAHEHAGTRDLLADRSVEGAFCDACRIAKRAGSSCGATKIVREAELEPACKR
jgi:hypothetical protein